MRAGKALYAFTATVSVIALCGVLYVMTVDTNESGPLVADTSCAQDVPPSYCGCMDARAVNYVSNATLSDGSCIYEASDDDENVDDDVDVSEMYATIHMDINAFDEESFIREVANTLEVSASSVELIELKSGSVLVHFIVHNTTVSSTKREAIKESLERSYNTTVEPVKKIRYNENSLWRRRRSISGRLVSPCFPRNPCGPGRCYSKNSTEYICKCENGYSFDGKTCSSGSVTELCNKLDCGYGYCFVEQGSNSPQCICAPGWTGKTCEERDSTSAGKTRRLPTYGRETAGSIGACSLFKYKAGERKLKSEISKIRTAIVDTDDEGSNDEEFLDNHHHEHESGDLESAIENGNITEILQDMDELPFKAAGLNSQQLIGDDDMKCIEDVNMDMLTMARPHPFAHRFPHSDLQTFIKSLPPLTFSRKGDSMPKDASGGGQGVLDLSNLTVPADLFESAVNQASIDPDAASSTYLDWVPTLNSSCNMISLFGEVICAPDIREEHTPFPFPLERIPDVECLRHVEQVRRSGTGQQVYSNVDVSSALIYTFDIGPSDILRFSLHDASALLSVSVDVFEISARRSVYSGFLPFTNSALFGTIVNTASATKQWTIVVRAAHDIMVGTVQVSLTVGGSVHLDDEQVALKSNYVPIQYSAPTTTSRTAHSVDVALTRASYKMKEATSVPIIALDDDGHIVDIDYNSGVGPQGSVKWDERIAGVLVLGPDDPNLYQFRRSGRSCPPKLPFPSLSDMAHDFPCIEVPRLSEFIQLYRTPELPRVNVLINDRFQDGDYDELGKGLEGQLCTCDRGNRNADPVCPAGTSPTGGFEDPQCVSGSETTSGTHPWFSYCERAWSKFYTPLGFYSQAALDTGVNHNFLFPPAMITADTDHDGLQDGEEVYGVDLTGLFGVDSDRGRREALTEMYPGSIMFNMMGALPRQKDVFMHVDSLMEEPLNQTDGGLYKSFATNVMNSHMNETERILFRGYYFGNIIDPFLAGTAADLNNPNDIDSLRLHFDIGSDPLSSPDDMRDAYDYSVSPPAPRESWCAAFVSHLPTYAARSAAKDLCMYSLEHEPTLYKNGVFGDWGGARDFQFDAVAASYCSNYRFPARINYRRIHTKTVNSYDECISLLGTQKPREVGFVGSMQQHRRFSFRYYIMHRSGAGQAYQGNVETSYKDIPVSSHEIGHTLGVHHWGGYDFGTNCYLLYPSMMNYLFGREMGYHSEPTSLFADLILNPISLPEYKVVPPAQASPRILAALASSKSVHRYRIEDDGSISIDWNFDGKIEDQLVDGVARNVRGRPAWCTYGGRVPFAYSSPVLEDTNAYYRSVSLVYHGRELRALYLNETGHLLGKKVDLHGADPATDCNLPDDPGSANSACLGNFVDFSVPRLSALEDMTTISSTVFDNAIVYVATLNCRLHRYSMEDGSPIANYIAFDQNVYSACNGAVVVSHYLPSRDTYCESIFFRTESNDIRWLKRCRDNPDEFEDTTVSGPAAGTVRSAVNVIAWPSNPTDLLTNAGFDVNMFEQSAILSFLDASNNLKLYYLDQSGGADVWTLLISRFIASAGHSTNLRGRTNSTKVEMAYVFLRDGAGNPLRNDWPGQLFISMKYTARPCRHYLYMSTEIGTSLSSPWIVPLNTSSMVGDQFVDYNCTSDTYSLLGSSKLQAMKSLLVRIQSTNKDKEAVQIVAQADGTLNENMGTTSDFEVMESGICRWIRTTGTKAQHTVFPYCPGESTNGKKLTIFGF